MYQKNKQGCLFYQKPQQAGMEILGCAQNDTYPAKSGTCPAKSDTYPAKSDTYPAKSGTCPAKSDTYPAKSGTCPAKSDTYAKRAEQGKKRHSQVRL